MRTYFHMSLMAINMARIEEGRPFVSSLAQDTLYERLRASGEPLHSWVPWLSKTFDDAEEDLAAIPEAARRACGNEGDLLARWVT